MLLMSIDIDLYYVYHVILHIKSVNIFYLLRIENYYLTANRLV